MNSFDLKLPSPLQELQEALLADASVQVLVKRDDLIHPEISGNKWRKLKYNIAKARNEGYAGIVTFGGAYSNHLFALASLGRMAGIRTVGVVRGDELTPASSPTLKHCTEQGMELHFVERGEYRNKEKGVYFSKLVTQEARLLLVPEGGSNALALPGVAEIIDECEAGRKVPDWYVVAAGTGGTAAGLLSRGRNVMAVAALKGADFLRDEIAKWPETATGTLDLQTAYHFGGYGKYNAELLTFIKQFEDRHQIPLEQVYTGKMFYGLFDLIKRGYFAKGSTLMAVHTGGLQGKLKL